MKSLLLKTLSVILLLGLLSCQQEDDEFLEGELSLEQETTISNLEKSGADFMVVCSIEGIPPGYVVEEYFTNGSCPNFNLFLGRYNAAIVTRDGTPKIFSAGAGCEDNYCIWIVGDNFESGCYVDVRSTTGSNIIGNYRAPERTLTTNAQGQQVITFRLRSAQEFYEFARRGLRIWVVNPVARKWADGRTVRRPRDIIIDPPCDPICP
ncbi:hypothetical protein [Aquimarina sp. MMG016]|uniref:hypothetical protein n=1 Tax=Aquimarina sp. MMG016 TaxID=2822690 RepID=UPI001B3A4C84|nr:hypothetical protein [Aquimarina sp. MMG016]MBQ4819334.1 hypothetical protein [Aquimarina sp. MMG016]